MINKQIKEMIDKHQENIFTSVVAKVTKVDWDSFTLNAKPKAKIEDNELPELKEIPIIFQMSGDSGSRTGAYFPVNKGDHVLLIFTKFDLKQTLKDSNTYNVSPERFSLNSPIAIPGLFSRKEMDNPDELPDYDGQGVKIVANKVEVDADTVNVGDGTTDVNLAGGGNKIARKGDSVTVNTYHGEYSGSISEGSSNVESG